MGNVAHALLRAASRLFSTPARRTGVEKSLDAARRSACATFLMLAAHALQAGEAADLARCIAQSELDSDQCYRIRDITLTKEDVRLYFTDGHILFGQPVAGAPLAAVFVTSVQGGDAEVLVLPPNKSERQSLASFTGSPNLNEHFKAAVLLFTDETYRDLMAQIRDSPSTKHTPEMGLTLAPEWTMVARNLIGSFESRLVLDLLAAPPTRRPFFFAAIGGRQLGNFDVVYDRLSSQQITIGQTAYRDNRIFFDIWTSFESRSFRNRGGPAAQPEFTVNDFRIEATLLPPDLRLQVVTRVKIKTSASSGRALPFELSRQMRVTAVSVDGQPAEVFERESLRSNLIHDRGNDLFLLIPQQPLQTGREYELEFHHEGAVIADAGNKVYAVGSRGNWYPNRGQQFARFDLTFRYPKDLDLVSSGDVVSDSTDGEWRVTRRRVAAPIRLAGFNLGVYDRVKVTRGKETVEVCANRNLERALEIKPRESASMSSPPEPWPGRVRRVQPPLPFPTPAPPVAASSPAARLAELAADVASALEFMTARFGPPPLPTLTVSPAPGTFGQGFPDLIYISTLSYLGPKDRPIASLKENQRLFFSEVLYAHET